MTAPRALAEAIVSGVIETKLDLAFVTEEEQHRLFERVARVLAAHEAEQAKALKGHIDADEETTP